MTVEPEPAETVITSKSVVRLTSDQLNRLTSVIETRERTAEWHPLVSRVSEPASAENIRDSVQEWEGVVAGIPVSGVSEVIAWEPGREYAFLNTERSTGLSVESRFSVTTEGDQNLVHATASFALPKEASALISCAEVSRFLGNAVEEALVNLAGVTGEGAASGAGQS